VAQSVQLPSREACGSCHFYGGGGEGVKHGSMDSSLVAPSRELDVHMGGMDFRCTTCHVPDRGEPHQIVGSRYSQPQPDNAMCQDCHTAEPHGRNLINTHADRIACQTCHIPAYARGGVATKMTWDWSTAGQKNAEGQPYSEKDAAGYETYNTKKGSFTWEENVVPEYRWHNGTVTYTLIDDPLNPDEMVTINHLHGAIDEPGSYIFPVKRFVGLQPYDVGRGTFAIPNLFPNSPEDTDAYWKAYEWGPALTSGMAAVDRPFEGPVGMVETEMYWIQNHMVAPKEQALQCRECHTYASRMNFAQLGYAPERAEQLQLMMQSDFWAGYPVNENGFANTEAWMGWVYVREKPWIYSYSLGRYLFMPNNSLTLEGGWGFAPR
jgi:octaheme c-type cytochrome (tetrathionate reductase family)